MIHGYPYTDFHELNLDYILKLCRETMGLHFDQADKFLKLVNQAGEEVSKIKVYYAETALKDDDGNVISTYIIDAGVDGNNVVFDRGNGEIITLTIPYATKAKTDVNNVDLTSYVHGVGVSGNKLLITFGDGNTYSFTVPFATKAQGDENGKNITTYVAQLSTANDKLVVTDGAGVTLAEITIPYAVKALNDVDGDAIKSTYGTDLTVDTTTVSLRAKDGSVISTITVPYAVKALTDTEGNTLLGDYGYHLTTNGNKVGIEAHNGTTLNEITVPFATLSTDATNAISAVSVSGDEIVFTTHGGTSYRITSPYSVKAQKDSLNNTLTHAYIASVTNDPDTGEIEFYAQDGTLIASLTPTLDSAIHDSYNNLIANYVKEIIVNPQNNYVVVNHGTGDSDTLTINYATHAYKDTYENVIGNTYIRSLSIIEDAVDHNEYLVAYNGELSELFRINLNDLSVVTDINDLSDVSITTPADGDVLIYDSTNQVWINQALPAQALDDLSDVTLTTPADGEVLTYDANSQEWINSPNISLKRLEIQANINESDLDYSADIPSVKFINAKYYDSATSSDLTVSEFITEMAKGRMVYLRLGTISSGSTKVLYTPIVYTDLIAGNSLTRTISVINKVGGVAYAGHYEFSFAGTPSINYVYDGTIDTPVVTPTPIDIGDLTSGATPVFTFNMIPISVLSSHTADTYYVNIDDTIYSRIEFFNYDIYDGSTFVVNYSNLAFAIQKLNESSNYKLNGKFIIRDTTGTAYTVLFHANNGDTFFTIDSVS